MPADAATIVLGILFALLAVPHVERFSAFVWLYFLRPSSIKKYLHGDTPYAIVTGATDGIGKATSEELLRQGFNLILHGRNEEKMKRVVEELRTRVPNKLHADIRFFIADASVVNYDFAKLVEPFENCHVTLVFHNVGGGDVVDRRLDQTPVESIYQEINKNSLFPLLLQRVLLPQLRRAAASGPVLVLFTGSMVADIAPPRIPVYAASKGFLRTLVHGLDNDERYFDRPTGVRYMYLNVAMVHSPNHLRPTPPDLMTPTSEAFARDILARVGCGYTEVMPFWVHSAMRWSLGIMGQSMVDRFTAADMKKRLGEDGLD